MHHHYKARDDLIRLNVIVLPLSAISWVQVLGRFLEGAQKANLQVIARHAQDRSMLELRRPLQDG